MRWHDIIIEAKRPKLSDYTDLGISPEDAAEALRLQIRPAVVARHAAEYGLEKLARWEKLERDRQAFERRESKWMQTTSAKSAELEAGTGTLQPRDVTLIIANDDALFDAVAVHTHHPDEFEDNRDAAQRIEALLRRMKPRRLTTPLWRGQCGYGDADAHKRAFHSWSPSRHTAEYFIDCGYLGARLRRLATSFRGFSLEELVTLRMRLRPGESHYSGSQAEWLILDPPDDGKDWRGSR